MASLDEKVAIVLSGGGAYGAYEVGVMKALFTGESPSTRHTAINPGIFIGTSVGALNSSLLLSQPEADLCDEIRRLDHIWTTVISSAPQKCGNGIYRFRGDALNFLDPRCYAGNPARPFAQFAGDSAFLARSFFLRGVDFLMSSGSVIERGLGFVNVSALVSTEPVEKLVRQLIPLEALRRSPRNLRIVATNWDIGRVRVFSNSDLTDEDGYSIILGSAAIPGFFPPQTVQGQPFVDGGVLMNTPLKPAIEAGADTLHVIFMDPDVRNVPLNLLESTIDVFDRLLLISTAAKVNEDIETARWINEGLTALERIAQGAATDLKSLIRVAGQIESRLREGQSYRKLTIHAYHPHEDLGGGVLGLLNFDRDRMIDLIGRGFIDTVRHDCEESKCVLPQ